MNEWFLLKEHARLSISEHFFTLLANFYVKNEKFHPARYLVIKFCWSEFISCVQSIQIQVQSAGIDSAMPYSGGSSSSDHFDKWLTTREISIFNSFQR